VNAGGAATVPAVVRELANESGTEAVRGYLKIMPLAFLVAMSIALLWPTRGLSAQSLWSFLETVTFSRGESVAAATGTTPSSGDRVAGALAQESRSEKPDAAAPAAQPAAGCSSGH